MATAKRRVAGTSFKIGTKASDGSGDTYTVIEGAKVVGGDVGGTYAVVDTTDLEDTVKQETKTLLDAGTVDLEMHEVVGDTGQGNLATAFADMSDVAYNFEIVFPDTDKLRFKAKVLSFQRMIGAASAVRMIRARISLIAPSTYVAAA